MGANIDRANRNKKIKDVNRQNRLLNVETILKLICLDYFLTF